MLDLLKQVVFSVRMMDFHCLRLLVDHGGIPFHVESFIRQGQQVSFAGLGFHAKVEIAGIMPAPAVQAGYAFAGRKTGEGIRPLAVTVEMVPVHRRHPRVIHMASSVPYPVFLIDPHVAHLNRQEVFKNRLPDTAVKQIGRDAENGGHRIATADLIKAGLGDIGEVKAQAAVAQEPAPDGAGPAAAACTRPGKPGCAANRSSRPPRAARGSIPRRAGLPGRRAS